MQRVAMELDAALLRDSKIQNGRIEYEAIHLAASWDWIHILTFPFLIVTYFRLRRRIRQGEVDVILFSSMVTATISILLRRQSVRSGVRVASIVHGQDGTLPVHLYQKYIIPKVFRAIDLVMPVSKATGEACIARGLLPEKLCVVHNGVDLSRFPAPEQPAGIRDGRSFRGDLPDGSFLLCSVGRQVKRKGFAWFIENVMPELPEHVHYWLGGMGPEGDSIRAAIQSTGMEKRVRLMGKLGNDDLRDLYQSADLFIMPNIPVPGDMEGFGIVMLEAGLNGLPTVASKLEGIIEVIEEGTNGYFVETGDTAGFVSRISDLDRSRTELANLSTQTREHILNQHGWDAVSNRYLDALETG